MSSFSENGWVLKDGTQRTHQLLGLFTSKFGKPARVYAAGASMGGLIAIRLIETWPDEFAGVLPACAVAGGLARQVDFMANVRVLFDLFYPGVLPGTAIDVPPGIDVVQDIVNPAVAAMTVDPTGAFAIASIAQTPVQFASGPELFESIATALGGAAGYPEILGLTHGQAYFDNTATQYTGALPSPTLAFINANVQRFSGTPAGPELPGAQLHADGRSPDSGAHTLDVPRSRHPGLPPHHLRPGGRGQRRCRLARPALGPGLRGRIRPLHLHAAGAHAGLLRPRSLGRVRGEADALTRPTPRISRTGARLLSTHDPAV